jgi:long-chain acyl-CoA synthetase
MNLAEILSASAERDPDKVAMKLDEAELTYAGLDDASARVAAFLRSKGVVPGDRIGLMLPNQLQFPIIYYGILRAGGVVVPMNVLLKRREVDYFCDDPGSRLLLAWHELTEETEAGTAECETELIEIEPDSFAELLDSTDPDPEIHDASESDTAVILYTSGTTGRPKGAELTHLNLSLNCQIAAEVVLDLQSDDIVLGALPLFHSFGQTVSMNSTICTGACLSLLPRFDPTKALEIFERDRVNVFQGVPTMYGAILNHPDRASYTTHLTRCMSGGAAMPVEMMRAFEEAFGAKILEGYGLSETSPVSCSNPPEGERKPGSVGIPIRGVEMAVLDDDGNELEPEGVGEIVIRGHNIMKGYWQRPEATEEAMRGGWFHSGDIGRRDEDGYFYIVDRMKDMIIRGGYNVFPREVEEVLYEHPDVLEAAVVGVPDESLGEEVGAAVVLRDGAEASAEDLSAHVKSQLAAYKYPRVVWFLDELPKGPTGKILKREIAAPEAARAPSAPR